MPPRSDAVRRHVSCHLAESQLSTRIERMFIQKGRSNLECFHLSLAHFGNSGMRESLAENLNLTGTTRHNLNIRHKSRLDALPFDETTLNQRAKTPAAWESVVDCCNHSELKCVNDLAAKCGITNLPFKQLEPLVEDTGERFFSECLSWMANEKAGVPIICVCVLLVPNNNQPLPLLLRQHNRQSPQFKRTRSPFPMLPLRLPL